MQLLENLYRNTQRVSDMYFPDLKRDIFGSAVSLSSVMVMHH